MTLEKARLYERYRLPYAAQAADDLWQQTGGAQTVADIGAGTGQLARLFAPRCPRVWAIEPDPCMRQVAAEVLAAWPGVHVVAACAEDTGLPAHSVDLVVAGNAFHRFRPDACEELHRVLRPGGWIALFTYAFTDAPHAEWLFSRLGTLPGLTARIGRAWVKPSSERLYDGRPTQRRTYPQSVAEDWDAFFGAARSGLEAPVPGDEEYAAFEAINCEAFDAFAREGLLHLGYETRVEVGQPLG
ncbi:MAG: class I SAM-dependent methyltransferase [Candidatus Latescibacterota bacterium]